MFYNISQTKGERKLSLPLVALKSNLFGCSALLEQELLLRSPFITHMLKVTYNKFVPVQAMNTCMGITFIDPLIIKFGT